jgi:hypothetical protein
VREKPNINPTVEMMVEQTVLENSLALQEFLIFLTNFSHEFLFLRKRSFFPGKIPKKAMSKNYVFQASFTQEFFVTKQL